MDTKKLDLEVKALEDGNPSGTFEAVLSAPTLDRDGEIIDERAFEPLPPSIPIHVDHGMDVKSLVARATPFYEGETLKVAGYFGSDDGSQLVRTKLKDGLIQSMSVGFMGATRSDKDGTDHVTKAEILEGSFVPVPSNRNADVLNVKSFEAKVGARNSSKDSDTIQAMHDSAVSLGAACGDKHAEPDEGNQPPDATTAEPEKAVEGTEAKAAAESGESSGAKAPVDSPEEAAAHAKELLKLLT